MSDLPALYYPEQQAPNTWAVIYRPDDTPFAFIVARDGEPEEDAEQRAYMLANVMNATVDMSSGDIRDLLKAYEQQHGKRHHADWRSDSEAE